MSLKQQLVSRRLLATICRGEATQDDVDAYKAYAIQRFMETGDRQALNNRRGWLRHQLNLFQYAEKGLKL